MVNCSFHIKLCPFLYKSRGELTEYLVINQDFPSPTPPPPHSQKNIQWMSRKGMSHTQVPSHQISMYSLENHSVSTPLLLCLSKKQILKSSRQIKNKDHILFWLRVNPKLWNSRIERFVFSSFSVIKYWHKYYFLSFFKLHIETCFYQYISCTVGQEELSSRFS